MYWCVQQLNMDPKRTLSQHIYASQHFVMLRYRQRSLVPFPLAQMPLGLWKGLPGICCLKEFCHTGRKGVKEPLHGSLLIRECAHEWCFTVLAWLKTWVLDHLEGRVWNWSKLQKACNPCKIWYCWFLLGYTLQEALVKRVAEVISLMDGIHRL